MKKLCSKLKRCGSCDRDGHDVSVLGFDTDRQIQPWLLPAVSITWYEWVWR